LSWRQETGEPASR